jgi:hypothetical protein
MAGAPGEEKRSPIRAVRPIVQVDQPLAKRIVTLDRHDPAVAIPQPIADPQVLLFPHDTS